jgi:hypothetical protein
MRKRFDNVLWCVLKLIQMITIPKREYERLLAKLAEYEDNDDDEKAEDEPMDVEVKENKDEETKIEKEPSSEMKSKKRSRSGDIKKKDCEEGSKEDEKAKPVCHYGDKCTRKNPSHWKGILFA